MKKPFNFLKQDGNTKYGCIRAFRFSIDNFHGNDYHIDIHHPGGVVECGIVFWDMLASKQITHTFEF